METKQVEETKPQSKSSIDIKMGELAVKKQLAQQALIGNAEEVETVKDKKTYAYKIFNKRYNNATEKIVKEKTDKFKDDVDVLIYDTATEKDGKFTFDKNGQPECHDKELGKKRVLGLSKLERELNKTLEETIVKFEPFIITDEAVLSKIDQFTKEELKGFLF